MPIGVRVGVGATVATLAFCAWLLGGWGSPAARIAVEDLGFVVLALFVTACCGHAAWRFRGRQRRVWICVTIGMIGYAVGSAIWTYYEWWLAESPFPTAADIAYLMLPVFVCIGLLMVPVGASGYTHTRLALDGFIVAVAFFQIGWWTVLGEVFNDYSDATRFAVGVALAYPVLDLGVLTVAVLVLGRARTPQRRALTLLVSGMTLMAVADGVFVYTNAHDDVTVLTYGSVSWAAGLLLIALAALNPEKWVRGAAEADREISRMAMWLPYVPLVFAMIAALVRFAATPGLPPALLASVVLIVLVLLRQFIVVAENRRLLRAVEAQALQDPLTGLANRALFLDRLTHAMALHRRDEQSVAVLSLDLDDFKLVNDGLGHPAGDLLLVQAAERILGAARSSDTVARIGGDEFVVLMEGDTEDSHRVALQVLRAFDEPFVIDGHALLLCPSAGLAGASAGEPEISADTLLKQADVAMYTAKRSRIRGVHVYSASDMPDDAHPEADDRGAAAAAARKSTVAFQLLGQLRHAIANQELTLAYQPKFDLRDESIVGVEALVRWPHPERGLLGPDQFLQLVRDHGLMRPITELVLSQALNQTAEWRDMGLLVPVAVNVFAPSLSDLALPETVERALEERGLPHEVLTVEITEDLLLDNHERARAVIERLRQGGVRVAIDDFGSGYSALSYLRELYVDELKLDRGFVTAVLDDRRAAAIVRAVIDLANELGLTTVAEGVEDPETATLLRDYGCQVAQGYLYSAPLTPPDMLSLLKLRRPVPDAAIWS
ncbi:putative bifunctional diguanylate cyclase/phosphodiesterase [Mycobacterium sp. Root265]|uniref:putative bifunctional diguanylate cyclase/phosphodiesterase n=1 Tax=Mycobacterium sp. Root265 TaxID=1736504 RepID=UPI0009EC607C|nr:bifunctional diguanylate cyclase/phosphodiesterase [Mycobacterium sp. Root265]